jgi:hypothetical protein
VHFAQVALGVPVTGPQLCKYLLPPRVHSETSRGTRFGICALLLLSKHIITEKRQLRSHSGKGILFLLVMTVASSQWKLGYCRALKLIFRLLLSDRVLEVRQVEEATAWQMGCDADSGGSSCIARP